MNHISLKWPAFAVLMLTIVAACTKIDTTQLGTDLIPTVDNINTFETILPVVANNYIVEDSTRLNAGDAHPVGGINNDGVFGKSSSSIFLEMKPSSFPATTYRRDSAIVMFDSAVLVLNYLGYYGDSNDVLNLKLYEAGQKMQNDTLVRPEYNIKGVSSTGQQLTVNTAKLWGEKSIKSTVFKDTIDVKRGDSVYERVVNQLRIPLNQALAEQLFMQDSLTGAFKSADNFKNYLPGFALVAEGTPQALLYLALTGGKLQFFYQQKNGEKRDTISSTLTFNSTCGHAIKFDRDRSGSQSSVLTTQVDDWDKGYDDIFIQTTPGIAAKIKIPGIDTFKDTNRVIHRAELRVTQWTSSEQGQRIPPNALYLDIRFDSTKNIYKGIPHDLSPYQQYYCYPAEDINFSYFGGITRYEKPVTTSDSSATYNFNLTRYLQGIVTRGEKQYELRLSAPFYNFYENCASGSTTYPQQVFPYTISGSALNPIGRGRVKVAGGASTVPAAVRMQLRIIYSKL